MNRKAICTLLLAVMLFITACSPIKEQPEKANHDEVSEMNQYQFPSEEQRHEGTWLNWPHHHTYGKKYRDEIEAIFLEIAYILHYGEKIHIIAYDKKEQARITELLVAKQVNMTQIDFVIAKSDDVWSRDTGPMFVIDQSGRLTVADFGFDGWGRKTPYKNDDKIPRAVAAAKGLPIVDISDFVLEGGSVELDGNGTAMLCKSAVLSKNRNKGMSIQQAESYLSRYLGVSNFIWLEGVVGEDITDAHIDGMARFYDDKTLLSVSRKDFMDLYEEIRESDYDLLLNARNTRGDPYKVITLPMTAENVKGLDYKGSYLNYYVGNEAVLVPIYNDINDQAALTVLSALYQGRRIVPIDVTALYAYGGMLHCITQQQPEG